MNGSPKYYFSRLMGPILLGLIFLGLWLVMPLTSCGRDEEKDQENEIPETANIATPSHPHSGNRGASEEAIKARTSLSEQEGSKASASAALETNATETLATKTTVAPLRPTSGQAQVNHQLLQVRGQVYVNMNYVAQGREGYAEDGTIKQQVGSLAALDSDEQSTFGVGNPYQYLDRTHVLVKIDGRWMIFQSLAISSWQIPSCVAHMTGTIQACEGKMVLFKVTQVPEPFQFLFPEDLTSLKAVALPSQSFPTEALENPAFVGQTWEVWFDGDLQGIDPSLPSPIQLGAVYQVCQVDPNPPKSKILPHLNKKP